MEPIRIGGKGNTTIIKSVTALKTAMTMRGAMPSLQCAIPAKSLVHGLIRRMKGKVRILTSWVWNYLP